MEAEKVLPSPIWTTLPPGLGSPPHTQMSTATQPPREGGICSLASNALLIVFVGPLIICLCLLTVSVLEKKAARHDANVTFQGDGNYQVVQPWRA